MSIWKSDENCSFLHHKFLSLKSFCFRTNIKHSTQCFITRWNSLKFFKNAPLCVIFSTLFWWVSVSSCDETLRFMPDILHERWYEFWWESGSCNSKEVHSSVNYCYTFVDCSLARWASKHKWHRGICGVAVWRPSWEDKRNCPYITTIQKPWQLGGACN